MYELQGIYKNLLKPLQEPLDAMTHVMRNVCLATHALQPRCWRTSSFL